MFVTREIEQNAAARISAQPRFTPKPPPRDSVLPLEALQPLPVERFANLKDFGVGQPTATEKERIIGRNDLVDGFYLERALIAARPVCRIVLHSGFQKEIGYATGFLISPRLMMTNFHVFEDADAALAQAEFDYRLDLKGTPTLGKRFGLRPDLFCLKDKGLDYAIVAVDEKSIDGASTVASMGFHRLNSSTAKVTEGEWVTIIQHPGGGRRQFAIRENELIGLKDDFLYYRSDTAQGSSGSPIFNDSFQVVGLHHSGKARRSETGAYVLKDGRTVPSLTNVDDALIDWEANEGIRASSLCTHLQGRLQPASEHAAELLAALEGDPSDVMTAAIAASGPEAAPSGARPTSLPTFQEPSMATIQVSIANITVAQVDVGRAAGPDRAAVTPPRVTEPEAKEFKLKQPVIDDDYSSRAGFDPDFLGVKVELPTPNQPADLSKLDDGTYWIPYEHFSVALHKKRRLALVTASNVDYRDRISAKVDPRYSRQGLTGLQDKEMELWKTDPRIPAIHQLPDVFYTKDDGAFDKGHIVRREDVCWSEAENDKRHFTETQRANGDTYHVTNCSPQTKEYNQAKYSADNWGKFEDYVKKQSAKERYCLFSGPVLRDDDPVFVGRDDLAPVRVKIPQSFWKVVVAVKGQALFSYAFVLKQDLSNVPTEFKVEGPWREHMVSLAELEGLVGLKFDPRVLAADQFETDGANEVAKSIGFARTPPVRPPAAK